MDLLFLYFNYNNMSVLKIEHLELAEFILKFWFDFEWFESKQMGIIIREDDKHNKKYIGIYTWILWHFVYTFWKTYDLEWNFLNYSESCELFEFDIKDNAEKEYNKINIID